MAALLTAVNPPVAAPNPVLHPSLLMTVMLKGDNVCPNSFLATISMCAGVPAAFAVMQGT